MNKFNILIAFALVVSTFAIAENEATLTALTCDMTRYPTPYGIFNLDKCTEKCVGLNFGYIFGYCNNSNALCVCTASQGDSLSRVRRFSPLCDIIINRSANGGIALQDNCDKKCSVLGMGYKSGFCKPDGFCKCTQNATQEPSQPEQPQPAEPAPAE